VTKARSGTRSRIRSSIAQRGILRLSAFGVVSIITTVVDFAVFNILIAATALAPAPANVVGYSSGILVSYALNKRYTFAGGGRERVSEEIAIFVIFNLLAVALTTAVVAGVAGAADGSVLALNAAKLAAGVGIWVAKYVAFRRWVYPEWAPNPRAPAQVGAKVPDRAA
jgi:putative flippase GtrA